MQMCLIFFWKLLKPGTQMTSDFWLIDACQIPSDSDAGAVAELERVALWACCGLHFSCLFLKHWETCPGRSQQYMWQAVKTRFPHEEERFLAVFCLLHRYTLAAQDLVMRARGVLKDRGWRISNDRLGSGDDISVYVIPLIHGNKQSWK